MTLSHVHKHVQVGIRIAHARPIRLRGFGSNLIGRKAISLCTAKHSLVPRPLHGGAAYGLESLLYRTCSTATVVAEVWERTT